MAKTKRSASASRSVGTVRIVCPQCGKRVSVPAKMGLGQQSFPCPSCRVPINRSMIESLVAENTAPVAEGETTDETAA